MLEPGAWAGSILLSGNRKVHVTVAVERWLKAKSMINWIADHVRNSKAMDFQNIGKLWRIFDLHCLHISYVGTVPESGPLNFGLMEASAQ
jgi:hypothetical protein